MRLSTLHYSYTKYVFLLISIFFVSNISALAQSRPVTAAEFRSRQPSASEERRRTIEWINDRIIRESATRNDSVSINIEGAPFRVTRAALNAIKTQYEGVGWSIRFDLPVMIFTAP